MLVSIGVMGLLIAIMLPSLTSVRETARRVACGSNMRQVGLGVHLYADANREKLPPTVRSETERYQLRGDKSSLINTAAEAMTMRFASEKDGIKNSDGWDGLGYLYAGGHLSAPGVFYCPSHAGDFRASEVLTDWQQDDVQLVGNYNLRVDYGTVPGQHVRLGRLDSRIALVTDGFSENGVLNHAEGANVLRVDGSVKWFMDRNGNLGSLLNQAAFSMPGSEHSSGPSGPTHIDPGSIWEDIDRNAGRAKSRRGR